MATRYDRVKVHLRTYVQRHPEKVAQWRKEISERGRAALIQRLGGQCSCGTTTGLKIVDRGSRLVCAPCWQQEHRAVLTVAPNYRTQLGQVRRSRLSAEEAAAERAKNNAASERYRKAHPERKEALRQRRRAQKLGAHGAISEREWAAVVQFFGGICLCCRAPGKVEQDHVVALTMGGTHTVANIQPLCRSCNSRKGTRTIEYRTSAEREKLHDIVSTLKENL